jgi:PAS domain S-box-containing protein
MSIQEHERGNSVSGEARTPPRVQLEPESLLRMLGEDVDGYATFQVTPDSVVTSWSPAAERLFGFSTEAIVGCEYAELYTPEDVAAGLPAEDLDVAATRGVLRAERRRLCEDGTVLDTEALLFSTRDDEGGLLGFVEVSRDRSDEVRTERRLSETEQRNRSLFDNNPDPAFELDSNGRFVRVNQAAEALTGYSRDELIGVHFARLLEPDALHAPEFGTNFERALGGEPVQVELTIRTQSGMHAELEVSAVPIEFGDVVSGVFGIAKDVSERNRLAAEQKRLLDQLGTERARLGAVVRQMPAGVLIVEAPSGRIVLGNALAEQILRQPLDEPVRIDSRLGGRIFDQEARPVQTADFPLSRAIRTGETVTGEELQLERVDGTRTWIRVHASPIRDPRGRIIAGVSIIDDIEQEKRAGESIRFLAEASSVLTSSLDYRKMLRRIGRLAVPRFADLSVIELVSPDGRIRDLQVAHSDGETERRVRSELRRDGGGRVPTGILARVLRSGEPELVPTLERRGAAPNEEDRLERMAHELELTSLLIVPLRGRHRVLGAIALAASAGSAPYSSSDLEVAVELARRSSSAIENAELFEAAAAASEAKSNFLAVVSHELRTPLNAIVGYCELLLMGVPTPIPATGTAQVERIRDSAENLRRIVEEILTFTRIEGGTEVVRSEVVDLRAALERSIEGVRALVAAKGLDVRFQAPDSPWLVETDGSKIGRILGHLLNNAVKFTDDGRIEVHATLEDGWIVMTVRDTGVGIEARYLEQIFEPFWQIDSSRTRRHEGTGLGLSVARQLTRLMGGEINVTSTPGNGTEFRVAIPVGDAGRL